MVVFISVYFPSSLIVCIFYYLFVERQYLTLNDSYIFWQIELLHQFIPFSNNNYFICIHGYGSKRQYHKCHQKYNLHYQIGAWIWFWIYEIFYFPLNWRFFMIKLIWECHFLFLYILYFCFLSFQFCVWKLGFACIMHWNNILNLSNG